MKKKSVCAIMTGTIGYQLKACGKKGIPTFLRIQKNTYQLSRIFKHDFFAVTALYQICNVSSDNTTENEPQKLVLKIARTEDFFGLPSQGLGRWLCRHEWDILKRLQHIEQVPRIIARFGNYGFLYEFIEGKTLDEKPMLPDHFFDQMETLVHNIHQQQIAYVDMNKRGNILLGTDNKPYMIDFQIACHIPVDQWGLNYIAKPALNILQKEDLYHLYKHKRRLRPDLMDDKQKALSRKSSLWITLHRFVVNPLRDVRRRILGYLYQHNHLSNEDVTQSSPETDPARWRR